jgi:hypothetical protein
MDAHHAPHVVMRTQLRPSVHIPACLIQSCAISGPNIRAWPAGTMASLRCFPRMRIREEHCNMVLLAVVTCISVAIAGGASLMGNSETKTVRFADRTTTGAVGPTPSPDKGIIYVNDQPPVRVIGAPFVPNTNPRER